jgi:hypothetical protein
VTPLWRVLVTVDMHRIHHSVVFEHANSNYGVSRSGIGFPDLHEHQPRAARTHRLLRPRIAAERLPETLRDVLDALADRPDDSSPEQLKRLGGGPGEHVGLTV